MGNELKEGKAKLSKGNRGVVFMCFACSVALSHLVSGSNGPRRQCMQHALNFTIAFAFEIKPTGGFKKQGGMPGFWARFLTRFLARFLTRVFDQVFFDRKYSVQYYWDVETQDQDRNQDQDQT